jgi:hypothetical protein
VPAMTIASIHEIKQELKTLSKDQLVEICLRLSKYKKDNKELLNYLLFEAHNENQFVLAMKEEIDTLFQDLPKGNVYFIKKTLRKILRFVNKQIKFSGNKVTEVELRVFFCLKVLQDRVPIAKGTVLGNLYDQQITKINSLFLKLPEDLQADYERDVKLVSKRQPS